MSTDAAAGVKISMKIERRKEKQYRPLASVNVSSPANKRPERTLLQQLRQIQAKAKLETQRSRRLQRGIRY
jgi:hypothetical protein